MVMQFPAQLAREAPAAYDEMLNNIGTLVVGDVAVDDQLTRRLAIADRPPGEVGNLLRSLNRGQWLVDLPAAYGDEDPKPFLVESLDPPAGHPDGDVPLSRARQTSFGALVDVTAERSWGDHGIRLDVDIASESEADGDEADDEATPHRRSSSQRCPTPHVFPGRSPTTPTPTHWNTRCLATSTHRISGASNGPSGAVTVWTPSTATVSPSVTCR